MTMGATTVRVPVAGRDLAIELPRRWTLLGELHPSPAASLVDPASALEQALASPSGCAALSDHELRDKRIVIAVEDRSRPTPLHGLFGTLLAYLLRHGVRRENLLVLPALGIHRPMTRAELEQKLGRANLAGLRCVQIGDRDEAHHVRLGTTSRGTEVLLKRPLVEADLVICLGSIRAHPLIGFSGGLKMIVPGLAHRRTIAQFHRARPGAERIHGVGCHDGPARLDLEEAAAMLRSPVFIVNAVLNGQDQIHRVVCGDPKIAQREGAQIAASIGHCSITEEADVVIVGSDPMNADLRQGLRAVVNASAGVKEQGLILGLLGCQQGIGDLRLPRTPRPHRLLRATTRALGQRRLAWLLDQVGKMAPAEERYLARQIFQRVRRNEIYVHSDHLPADAGRRLGLFRQFPSVERMLHQAVLHAPERATVYVMPQGGAVYPVLV